MNVATRSSSAPASRPGGAVLRQQRNAYASSPDSAERGRQNQTMSKSEFRNRYPSVNRRPVSSTGPLTSQLLDQGTTGSIEGSLGTGNTNTAAQSPWRRWVLNIIPKRSVKTPEELKTLEAYAKVKYEKDENNIEIVPAIARQLNSSQSFRMHRKFGLIWETLLLRRGIELTRLWEEWKTFHTANINDEWTMAQTQEEEKILCTVQSKLEEYEKLHESYVRMAALAPVSDKNFQSVRNFIVDHQSEVDAETENYFLHKYDIATTTAGSAYNKEKSWVAEKIENCLESPRAWKRLPQFIFQNSDANRKFGGDLVWHGEKSTLTFVSKFIFAFVVAIAMLIPTLPILLFDWEPKVRASLVAASFVFCVVVLGIIVDLDERELFLCIAALGAIFLAVLGNTFDRSNSGPGSAVQPGGGASMNTR